MADNRPQDADYVAVTEQALVRAETEVERAPLEETSPLLVRFLIMMGDEWGPLGVALAAAQLSDPETVIRELQRRHIDGYQEGS